MARKTKVSDETKYPLISLKSIQIVDRPEPGQEHTKLFFNTRQPQSFTPESLAELTMSIRTDELLEPLVVRMNDGVVELVAGERRIRSLLMIVSKNLACFCPDLDSPSKWQPNSIVLYYDVFAKVVKHVGDEVEIELLDADDEPTGIKKMAMAKDLKPTVAASKLYAKVPCKLIERCSDERALRINSAENGQSQPLTISEEISVVERLSRMGLKQDKIAYMLSTNITWVSQTASFREHLPAEAFQKLLSGQMARNVAVGFFGYAPKDRQKLYENTVKAEEEETAEKIRQHQLAQEAAEDEAEILTDAADKVEDPKTVAQIQKKAAAAKRKAAVEKKKAEKAKSEAGVLKQGHIQKGAARADLKPKKEKMLPRTMLADMLAKVDEMLGCSEGVVDPICERKVGESDLLMVREVLHGVLSGERDPLAMIRTVKVKTKKWTIPDRLEAEAAEEDADADADDPDDTKAYEDSEYDPEVAEEYDVYDEDYGDVGDAAMDDVDNWD